VLRELFLLMLPWRLMRLVRAAAPPRRHALSIGDEVLVARAAAGALELERERERRAAGGLCEEACVDVVGYDDEDRSHVASTRCVSAPRTPSRLVSRRAP